MSSPTIIRFDEVSKVYTTRHGEVHALEDVSLTVAAGQYVAVRGPSGCGKSTLLSLIGGLALPTSGRITVGDLAMSSASSANRGLVVGAAHRVCVSAVSSIPVPECAGKRLGGRGPARSGRDSRLCAAVGEAVWSASATTPSPLAVEHRGASACRDGPRTAQSPQHPSGRRTDRQSRSPECRNRARSDRSVSPGRWYGSAGHARGTSRLPRQTTILLEQGRLAPTATM